MAPETGLPRPDALLFMSLPAEEAERRGGFGEERYEESSMQARVRERYAQLQAHEGRAREPAPGTISIAPPPAIWCTVDAVGTIDEVAARIREIVDPVVADARAGILPLRRLWDGHELSAADLAALKARA
jgi:dTMP kinase